MASATKLCLITGGSGFLSTQIALLLLERGHRIRSTFRSQDKAQAWKDKFTQYNDRVECVIVEDMAVERAFDEAVRGVEVVFHAASPFHFSFKNNEKEMLIPAREGCLNLLRAAATESSIERVIVTSSFAAITSPHLDPRPGHVYTEEDWNPSSWEEAVQSKDLHFVYLASKTFAEKAVWDFVEDKKPSFSVTTIVPPIILGRPQQPFSSMTDINQSSRVLWRMVDAKTIPETPAYVCVDVYDCALCHVLALEKPVAVVANKRYLTVGAPFTQTRAVKAVAKLFPEQAHRLPAVEDDIAHYAYSSSLVETDLGIRWTSFEDTVKVTFEQLLEVEGRAKRV